MERKNELLAQSRKFRREFSLSKSFIEQLSLLINFFIGENLFFKIYGTLITLVGFMILHYIIVLY